MAKRALAHARNLELRAAIGVGTGYQGVGSHPISFLQRALLCRQQGQKRREGIHRERRTLRKNEVLPFYQEAVAHMMRTDEGFFTGHDLNLKVVQLKLVGHVDSYQTHL